VFDEIDEIDETNMNKKLMLVLVLVIVIWWWVGVDFVSGLVVALIVF